MKILMVNKFLYPNGGSETYIFKLGDYLKSQGHEVQYFGMADDRNIAGNQVGSYTSNVDFRAKGSIAAKSVYPFKIIYSKEARKKIKVVLEQFKPDIVHLNNINFQLTPSIIYEIKEHGIPVVQTVHDSQIACPSHRLYIETSGKICEKCVGGKYLNCLKEKCIQGSALKSAIAMMESFYYHKKDTYNLVDKYICPSQFMGDIIKRGGVRKDKVCIIHNFSDEIPELIDKKVDKPYALYFGRISKEKGIVTLISVCKDLPEIQFVFAGAGPLENLVTGVPNIEYAGFKTGAELQNLIHNARFSIYPSEWYENCPLSVIESQAVGTPVIGSDLGGTKELIDNGKTGIVFKGLDKEALRNAIELLWNDKELTDNMSGICLSKKGNTIDVYTEKLLKLYKSLLG